MDQVDPGSQGLAHGLPTKGLRDLPARFQSKISVEPFGCWRWTGALNSAGYGNVGFNRQVRCAHRVVYELLVGEVSVDLDLDHLCRNPACVNPAHLEPVTHRENVLRGVGGPAINAKLTHCRRGHELVPKPSGTRYCRTCHREQQRKAVAQ